MPSSATRCMDRGDCSAVFRTTAHPAASAGATFHEANVSGKFHGTTAATTPAGSLVTSASSPSAVGVTSP